VLSPEPASPADRANPRSRAAGDLVAGAVCALVLVAYAGSCSGLIFSGPLNRFVGQGMVSALISTVLTILVLSRWSSYRLSLGGPDSNSSAILAITTAAIAGTVLGESGPDAESLLPTLLMWVAASALGCGLILLLIGKRRWGRCVRFMPYPVMGGFLAGTGYLLVVGSFKMLTGVGLGSGARAGLAAVPPVAWITALATGLILTVLMRWMRRSLAIPTIMVAAAAFFFLGLFASHESVAQARVQGLLMDPVRMGDWLHAFNFPYRAVRWDLILRHWNDFAVMTLVVIITCLLNATSIDLATSHDVDIDRELRATGLANVLSGLAGGMVAVNSFNRTLLSQQAGAASPWAARCCAALIVLLMVAVPGATSFIPRAVLTGLILYLGLSLLLTWLWDARRTMLPSDLAIVGAIVVIVAVSGIVAGVFLGLLIACLNFVFTFSRSPAVKYAFTGVTRRSNVERTTAELHCLQEGGAAIKGFVLQGHLFFGTASSVLDEIRRVLGDARFVVLDLWLVRGLDSSSAMAFAKIRKLVLERQAHLVIVGAAPGLLERLRHANFDLRAEPIRVFPDLDHGLEWCEDQLIAVFRPEPAMGAAFGATAPSGTAAILARYLVPRSLRAGEKAISHGESSEALYLVDQGQVSIYLRSDAGPAGALVWRARTYGPGTVVGEMGLYSGEPRSADVVADVDTVLLVLTRERLEALEREEPAAAAHFHRQVVTTLSLRLQAANNQIRLLL